MKVKGKLIIAIVLLINIVTSSAQEFTELITDYEFVEVKPFSSNGLAAVSKEVLSNESNNASKYSKEEAFMLGLDLDNDKHEITKPTEDLESKTKEIRWGYIDTYGNIVIDFEYFHAENFENGLAKASSITSSVTATLVQSVIVDKYGKHYTSKEVKKFRKSYIPEPNKIDETKVKFIEKDGLWALAKVVNLNDLINIRIEKELLIWQEKGKFEKTEDYNLRMNEYTIEEKKEALKQEVINQLATEKIDMTKVRNDYDADREVFKLYFDNLNPIKLEVPIHEAESFDNNFENIEYLEYNFSINESNNFEIVYLKAFNPDNYNTYVFNSGN